MQDEENILDFPEEAPLFNMKEWLRNIFFSLKIFTKGKAIWLSCLFFPWYIWTITLFPEPVLWWIVASSGLLLLTMMSLHPRSALYWFAPCLLLFNTTYFWLPWPGIKISYIASAALCFGGLINSLINSREDKIDKFASFDFKIFFICLLSSALIGILSFFDWNEPAAWSELAEQLRMIPILSEKERYVSLRYVWVWLLAISVYSMLRRYVKKIKDIKLIFWSLQLTSIPIAVFGLYSYISKHFMVSHYIYERRINSTLSSPAVLADIFMSIFVIGTYLLKESKSLKIRLFLIFTLIMQLSIIFMSGCRTNFILIMIYLIILTMIYLWRLCKKAKWYYSIGTILLFIMLGSTGLHITGRIAQTKISKLPVIRRIIEWDSEYKHGYTFKKVFLKGRFNHWLAAENMIKENPVWGVGCGLFEQKYKSYHSKKDLFWYARAHCIPLRICAEGGFVTLAAFLIFILLVIIRLSYGFTRRARVKEPEWSKLTRTMAILFLMVFTSSFFTDIFYENSESIIFLSLISVCGASANKHTGRLLNQHFLFIKRRVLTIERNLNIFFLGIGWEYLGFIRIKTVVKFLILSLLAIIIYFGLSSTNSKRQKLFFKGKITYGFLNCYKKSWYLIGKRAMAGFIVKSPIISFHYKSFNTKTAKLNQYLKLYINNMLAGTIPLDSVSEQIIYCDVSKYLGNKVKIDFKVNRTFIPLKEKWFIDSHNFGALIKKPKQINVDLKTVNRNPKIKWITNPDFQPK